MILSDLKGKINASGKIGGVVGNNANIKGRIIRGVGGTSNYEELENLPAFNDVVIEGNQDPNYYGIAKLTDIPTIPVYNLVKTKLWDYSIDNGGNIAYSTGTYTLHDDINNYDIIVLELASYSNDMGAGNAWNGSAYITLFPYLLNNGYYHNRINVCTFASRSTNWEIKNDYISKRIDNEGSTNGLISVWGIKLGAIV